MANKSYADCVGVIQKAAGDWLSKDDAEKILAQIDEVVQLKKNSGALASVESLVMTELDNATNAIRETALIEKRNALINAKVQTQVLAHARKFSSPMDGLRSLMGGVHKNVEGSLNSIDANGKSLTNGFLGKLLDSMEKENLTEFFTSGKFDKEIAKELWSLHEGTTPVTGMQEARRIAEIINGIQNELVYRQNRAGAFIKLLPGYIVRQAHDMFKIRKAGFNDWMMKVAPLLDAEKTFGTSNQKIFLREAYEGFVSGMHYKAKAETAADSVTYFLGFKGPSNLAKKVSQERLLHFKDSDAWMAYNAEFGSSSFRESVLHGVEHSSRNIALMEGLGTNPLAMLDNAIKILRSENKNNTKVLDSFKDYTLHNLYMQLDGTSRIPVYHKVAMIGTGVRVIQNLAKLGGAVLSSVTDIPFQAAALRLNGVPLLDSYANAFTNVLRGRGDVEQKQIANLIGVGFDGLIKDVASRFAAEDNIGGRMAKLQQKFFKLNLMNWWNDSHKTGVALMLSHHLANHSDVPYEKLPDALKKSLSHYDISSKEWSLVKDLSPEAEDKIKYFTPNALSSVSDSRIKEAYGLGHIEDKSVLSREIRKARDDLESKFRTYLVDQVEHAVPHPGAAEQALLTGPTQPGTVLGEAVRFIGQFKSFPLTVVRKGLAPHLYNDGAENFAQALFKGKADYTGLVHLMVSTTVFGYLALLAKDTVMGRTPRDVRDPKTWVAAMAQGGGLGIYSDFLFGEFNKYGHSALATLLGPTASQFEDVAKMYSRAKSGDKVAGQAMRTVINNTPFANLFYTRLAIDYLFLFHK